MRGDKAFFDTNVLIYAFAQADPRAETATILLATPGVIGVQILNEFVAVATRKLGMSWAEIDEVLNELRILFPSPLPLTVSTHAGALRLSMNYGYNIYDALVIAAALEGGCTTLYSEDMHDGQTIEGLTIRNPFPPSARRL